MSFKLTTPIRLLGGGLLLIALLLGVEYLLGWQAVLIPWRSLHPLQALIAVALVLASYVIRTLRLLYFFPDELKQSLLPALKLMLAHNFWNNLLPMRSGEISFPILMQSYFRIGPGRSIPALLWFRLLDLYAVFMLGVIALMLSGDGIGNALLLAVGLTAAIPVMWKLLPGLLGRVEGQGSNRISRIAGQIRNSFPSGWRALAVSTGWTLLNWAVKLAAFAWILAQFIAIDATTAMLGAIGGELTSVLPVHGIAGAGTYEAGIVVAMLPADVDYRQALLAAVNLHIFVLSCALLGGAASYLMPGKSIPAPSLRHQD
ncbi:MAG: flippase-like domain-containing protein [Gammaproteobacteria bacterium]|nr:flippase-like domain-containing protein [Gammaproteobacteria bacterium]MDH3534773.1 flippase-like domain-containing protein [Gammaproteobacteria bacterium]